LYFWILGSVMVLLWSGYVVIDYWQVRTAEQSMRARAKFDVLLLEEHLSRTLGNIAGRLVAAREISSWSDQGPSLPSVAVLADLIFNHHEVRSISLVDGEGLVLASSKAENVAMRVSADILPQKAGKEWGKARLGGIAPYLDLNRMHLGGIAPYRDLRTLALGGPPESSALWLATLPARDPPDAVKWVAAINIGIFENFWEQLYETSALKVGVFDYSGRPLVGVLGSDLDAAQLGANLVRRVEVAERGIYDDKDNPALMVSYRSSAAYPLIIAVVGDRRALQAELVGDRRTAFLVATALSAVIVLLLWFLYRGQLRYYLLDERLSEERRQRDAATAASEERRIMEEKLRESQKLEAIGQLTGGLAHDFNNLLGIVVGNLDLIEERLAGADERLRRQFNTAREAALRGAEVTRALLAVARRQPLEVQSLDINTLLLEIVPLVRSSAGSAVSLSAQLAPETLVARIDAGSLSSAVLNLVINARDAMQGLAGEHRITLRTRREQIAVDADPDLAPGGYAVLEVSDNGPGMSALVRAQVFEPFFTTKERGKGTGLGLPMVRGFAEQLGGTARIDSIQGTGTTVRLYLPLDATATQSADAGEAARLASLHALNVLDTPPEAEFDALVAEAAQVCGTPIALISLIDSHRQWFKAKVGLEAQETARVDAFCAHTILEPGQTLMVEDAARDLRFSNNPLVRGDPKIRFYAGVPLGDANGQALGTLCVIDRQPRSLNPAQHAQLLALARRAGALLRARAPAPAAPALAQPAATTPAAHAEQAPKDPAPRRVLVVDDEEGLCELACNWLQSLGYETTSVLSPDAALEQLAGQHFDVLFTDVVMPGSMDGIDLARAALARQPGLRVLLTSGYARNLTDKGALPGPLLNKPYRKKDLAKAFEALDTQVAS